MVVKERGKMRQLPEELLKATNNNGTRSVLVVKKDFCLIPTFIESTSVA